MFHSHINSKKIDKMMIISGIRNTPTKGCGMDFFFEKYEISTIYLNIFIMHHAVHKNSL